MYHTGSFIKGQSRVHHLDPRLKLAATILFSLVVLRLEQPVIYAAGVALFLLALACGISLRTIGQSIKPLLFFMALIFVTHLFFGERKNDVAINNALFGFSFSCSGLQQGFLVLWQFVCLMVVAVLLTMTTAPSQLVAAIRYYLRPFAGLRLPVDDVAVMIMLAFRMMPILLAEKERMEHARSARGFDPRRSGLLAGVKSFVLLTSKIISGVFRRADEIALAMDARNYQRRERSSFAELKFASADYLIMVVLCFSLVSFVPLNLYFG